MRAAGGAGASALSGFPATGYGDRRKGGIREILEKVDPLECPKCGGVMKIISFIERGQQDVVERILRHCGLWEGPIRTLAGARAPPQRSARNPDEPELVMDPEFLESERLERRLERQADAGCELQLILDPDFLKPVPQALFSPSLPPVR